MHLVGNEVVQFEEVNVSHRDFLPEGFAGSAIVKDAFPGLFTAFRQVRLRELRKDFRLGCTVENGRLDIDAQCMACPAEVNLQDLSDVHTRWHAERVQHDIYRCSIGQVRHIFSRQNLSHHTFVAVTPRHLVADGNVARGGNIDFHQF